jgi:cytochrome c553
MPSDDYVKFSDADLGAVVAYIQSRPAIDRDTLPHELGLLAKALLATGQIPFPYDKIDHTAAPPVAAPGPTKEWGGVLIGTCTGCHGPTLAGGPIVGADPSWPPAANLTPDQATGIGGWSFADFETAMRRGKRPDGTDIRMPMPWQMYTGMADQDMRALWEHLRSVPARPEGGT